MQEDLVFIGGLSYDVVDHYNKEDDGTAIVSLLWTNDKMTDDHGGYKKFHLFATHSEDNAGVICEQCLVSNALGKVVPLRRSGGSQ